MTALDEQHVPPPVHAHLQPPQRLLPVPCVQRCDLLGVVEPLLQPVVQQARHTLELRGVVLNQAGVFGGLYCPSYLPAGEPGQVHRLLAGDSPGFLQLAGYCINGDSPEVDLLAPGEDGVGNRLAAACQQYQQHRLRRFLQELEQGVGRLRGQGGRLLEYEHPALSLVGLQGGRALRIPHLVYADVPSRASPGRVRLTIDDLHVRVESLGYADALVAGAAWPGGRFVQAVDPLGQVQGQGRLANLGRPHEYVGVGEHIPLQASGQQGNGRLVSHHLPHGQATSFRIRSS